MVSEKPKRSALKRSNGPVQLPAKLEKSLSAYSSAAAAGGVSLFALMPAANAKIVYTPAHTPIPVNQYVLLDLNQDGIADFFILNSARIGVAILSVGCASIASRGGCYQTDQMWGRGVVSGRFASALPAGFKVGANKSYFRAAKYPGLAAMGWVVYQRYGSFSSSGGQWLYARKRYLGLQFVIGEQVHYGWARLSVSLKAAEIAATLTGYAYETVPNKPIITGKTKGSDVITLDPATLGHLAVGASQVQAWRGGRNRAGTLDDSRRKTGQGSETAP